MPDSKEPLGLVPSISLGGWGGWGYGIGSKLALTNAVGESIRVYCIFDSDYHTPEEREARYQEAHDRGVELHIWKWKEIENYLIVPQAIVRIVNSGHALTSAVKATVDLVEKRIDELTEIMRDSVFDAMSHEYCVRDRAGGTPKANRQARERIKAAWNSREGRMSLVSGKLLASRLSEWSKTECGVSFSISRLAQELRADEIPSEMRTVMLTIERGGRFLRNGE